MSAEIADVVIIGAGAAGLMCAMQAAGRGRKVVVLDHSDTLGKKILISGGGRCNFTNLYCEPDCFVSSNPHFAKSALSRYTCGDFIELVEKNRIRYHEKKLGQLFCDDSASRIVDMLEKECSDAGARIVLNCRILSIARYVGGAKQGPDFRAENGAKDFGMPDRILEPNMFLVSTSRGTFACRSLVIATGGLSVPKVGATGLGYSIADHYGLAVEETAPALDGFVFSRKDMRTYDNLYGIAVDALVSVDAVSFRENILFTHKGLSGPASLQASLYWRPGEKLSIDFCPDIPDPGEILRQMRGEGERKNIKNVLSQWLPARFGQKLAEVLALDESEPLAQMSNRNIDLLCRQLKTFTIEPVSTVGYVKAEVTRGGVSTAELSSSSMAAKKIPGLFFIGEVVDVTGRLGGFNFQWAWSSGHAAGQAV